MGFSPFSAGDGRPWLHTFTTDSGVFSLAAVSNGSIAFHLEDINNDNTLFICTGAYSIIGDGSGGTATFTPSAHDLLTTSPLGKSGYYLAYPVVTLSTGPVPMDSQTIKVVSLP